MTKLALLLLSSSAMAQTVCAYNEPSTKSWEIKCETAPHIYNPYISGVIDPQNGPQIVLRGPASCDASGNCSWREGSDVYSVKVPARSSVTDAAGQKVK